MYVTHNEGKFESPPCQRDILGMMLSHDVEDITVVNKFLRQTSQPKSCLYLGFFGSAVGGCEGRSSGRSGIGCHHVLENSVGGFVSDSTLVGGLCISDAALDVEDGGGVLA